MTITPFAGWALARVIALDELHPGLAGHVLRASPERRQVIAAYLSLDRPHDRFASEREQVSFLMQASHGAILHAAFDLVPAGFRGALARSGAVPHGRRYYRYLHALLSAPASERFSDVIARLPNLDPERLQILRALPVDLRHSNIIAAVSNSSEAPALAAFVTLLAEHGVERCALTNALTAATDHNSLIRIAERWAFKISLPAHPVPATEGYLPINDSDELRRSALRFRNCLRTYLANILEQRSTFAVVRRHDKEAVVHLVASAQGWQLDRLYGTANRSVDPDLRQWTEQLLATNGITRRRRTNTKRLGDPIRQIIGHYDPEEIE